MVPLEQDNYCQTALVLLPLCLSVFFYGAGYVFLHLWVVAVLSSSSSEFGCGNQGDMSLKLDGHLVIYSCNVSCPPRRSWVLQKRETKVNKDIPWGGKGRHASQGMLLQCAPHGVTCPCSVPGMLKDQLGPGVRVIVHPLYQGCGQAGPHGSLSQRALWEPACPSGKDPTPRVLYLGLLPHLPLFFSLSFAPPRLPVTQSTCWAIKKKRGVGSWAVSLRGKRRSFNHVYCYPSGSGNSSSG